MSFLNTGSNKCALVIGINYNGNAQAKLNGCINDANRINNFLKERCGFSDNNITMLTDDTAIKPTKQDIINCIRKLVQKVKDENAKEVWFSYSGHGSYLPNIYGNEKDKQDEALVPIDYAQSGLIRDDQLYNIFVSQLPTDCNVFCIVDACHSGTALDLPYVYRIDTGIETHRTEDNLANILKISGSRDSQTSADAYINGKYQGALTFSFLKTMDELDYCFTSKQIIGKLKEYLNQSGYPQIPTLSLSKKTLLNELVMGDSNDIMKNPNILIHLSGDSWCDTESSWNILSLKDNKLIFDRDKKFYTKNEKINFRINLDSGKYILVLKDNYGDGGIKGHIEYTLNSKKIKEFDFNKGTYQSIDFEVNLDNQVQHSIKKNMLFQINCDYYGVNESKWNIVDSLGHNIFAYDRKFFKSNENQVVRLKLDTGNYKLKCMDNYGDGGINGFITNEDDDNKKVLTFKWANLNWRLNNGYEKYYDFIV